ncbi:hypothetical protein [Paenibacillus baekrokdamisoli]|nr:hypothetical protein [Paenibacillus baekrokdamisoli]
MGRIVIDDEEIPFGNGNQAVSDSVQPFASANVHNFDKIVNMQLELVIVIVCVLVDKERNMIGEDQV